MTTIEWPKWEKIINEKFIPLTKCNDRYLILYGSRGSSKSDFATKLLIYRCLSHKYFKCILYRKNYNSIKDSSFETLKQAIFDLGLESLFVFKQNPLEIICLNGNKFIARGGDDPNKLKSIKDPSCVWYEEDVPEENDFATITLTIRGGKAELLQEIFTINPQVEGNPEDNWFWQRFFLGHNDLSFRHKTTVELEDINVDYHYTVHHSTYQDNRWLPNEVRAQIEDYKTKNVYLYSVYAKGLWTAKETGGNFYKDFNRGKHIGQCTYNPDLPLHISFDFNVNPYMTCTIFQLRGKKIEQIDEICAKNPYNNTPGICKLFMQKYFSHAAGVFVYGDPSGNSEDTRSEKGQNDYRIILTSLAALRPQSRVHRKAPSVAMRGNFINAIFEHEFDGISININEKCVNSISDFSYLKEDSDGTKYKQKVKDDETKVTYEKYGHCSDAFDYMITVAFAESYAKFQSGGSLKSLNFGKNAVSKNRY